MKSALPGLQNVLPHVPLLQQGGAGRHLRTAGQAAHPEVRLALDLIQPLGMGRAGRNPSADTGCHTADGCEIHFAPRNATMVETIVRWYSQGDHHSRVSWVVQDSSIHSRPGQWKKTNLNQWNPSIPSQIHLKRTPMVLWWLKSKSKRMAPRK